MDRRRGENPTEEKPQGHAEAVEVVFDPERLSYRELLEYFFQVHRADLGEDLVGSIYRSEIFYTSEEQRRVAEETIADVDASGHWLGKTMTEISEAGRFWEDPPESQDHLLRFPDYPEGSKPPFPRTAWKLATARPWRSSTQSRGVGGRIVWQRMGTGAKKDK